MSANTPIRSLHFLTRLLLSLGFLNYGLAQLAFDSLLYGYLSLWTQTFLVVVLSLTI